MTLAAASQVPGRRGASPLVDAVSRAALSNYRRTKRLRGHLRRVPRPLHFLAQMDLADAGDAADFVDLPRRGNDGGSAEGDRIDLTVKIERPHGPLYALGDGLSDPDWCRPRIWHVARGESGARRVRRSGNGSRASRPD